MTKTLRKALLIITLTLVFVNTRAQSEEDAVKSVVNALFDGMRSSDTAKIRSAFHSTALLQTIFERNGKTFLHSDPVDSFLVAVARPHSGIYDERIIFGSVKIDGQLASVWTPYKFYLGEKFSHCGVNSFQLVKLNGQWKIQYLIDTRRREACIN